MLIGVSICKFQSLFIRFSGVFFKDVELQKGKLRFSEALGFLREFGFWFWILSKLLGVILFGQRFGLDILFGVFSQFSRLFYVFFGQYIFCFSDSLVLSGRSLLQGSNMYVREEQRFFVISQVQQFFGFVILGWVFSLI